MTTLFSLRRSSGSLALLLFVGIAAYLWPLKPSLLAIQGCFSEDCFRPIYVAWKETEVLARYQFHFAFDFVLLATYAVFGWSMASHRAKLSNSAGWPVALSIWSLPMAAAADFVENLLQLVLLRNLGEGHEPWMYVAAGVSTATKWFFLLLFPVALRSAKPSHAA